MSYLILDALWDNNVGNADDDMSYLSAFDGREDGGNQAWYPKYY